LNSIPFSSRVSTRRERVLNVSGSKIVRVNPGKTDSDRGFVYPEGVRSDLLSLEDRIVIQGTTCFQGSVMPDKEMISDPLKSAFLMPGVDRRGVVMFREVRGRTMNYEKLDLSPLLGFAWVMLREIDIPLLVGCSWIRCGSLVGYLRIRCGSLVGCSWIRCGSLVGYLRIRCRIPGRLPPDPVRIPG